MVKKPKEVVYVSSAPLSFSVNTWYNSTMHTILYGIDAHFKHGITNHVKDDDGALLFESKEEAQAKVRELNKALKV